MENPSYQNENNWRKYLKNSRSKVQNSTLELEYFFYRIGR